MTPLACNRAQCDQCWPQFAHLDIDAHDDINRRRFPVAMQVPTWPGCSSSAAHRAHTKLHFPGIQIPRWR